MEDVEVGHGGGDAVELVHQPRLDIVEKLGAHDGLAFGALRLSSGHKKESVNFCLNGGSGLPKSLNKKAHGYTVSISAFSLGLEIVQISIHLKSKNALYQKIINVYFFLLIFNKVWFLSIFTSAKVQKNPIVRR